MRRCLNNILAISAVLLTAACTTQEEDVYADEFQEGQGQDPIPGAVVDYPDVAEWGADVGQVLPNWGLVGFANSKDPALPGVQLVNFADFYNPHGYEYAACVAGGATDCAAKFPDALYPAGSPWVGQPKPRALSVGISAVWCPPCNEEAKSLLPGKYAAYKPKGGHFVVSLLDGPTQGEPATINDATKWVTKYTCEYSVMTDPRGQLSALFAGLLPSNTIIRTSDMRIIMAIDGAPMEKSQWESLSAGQKAEYEKNGKFWEVFDEVLAVNTTVPIP